MNKIIKIYKKCWKYLKESRNYLVFILALFLSSIILGLVFPGFFSETIKNILQNIIDKTKGMDYLHLFVYIFQNNLVTGFIGMILGVILGVFPVIITLFNGYVLGVVMNKSAGILGWGILARLLPHGIFEIPAVIISLGLGVRIGTSIFTSSKTKKKIGKGFLYNLKNSLLVFIFIVIPLLIIAGLIEASLMFVFG